MVSAIITAGGSGLRMKTPGNIKKQYLKLGGLPILKRTGRIFLRHQSVGHVVFVVPPADIDYCRNHVLPLTEDREETKVTIVAGGESRRESVFNGLTAIDRGIVLIHDGVRPFITSEHIDACIRCAEETGACIPAVPASDTLKEVDGTETIRATVDRGRIRMAQTPQAFQYELIRKAHDTAKMDEFPGTDDASLLERLGIPVKVIPGSPFNIKITTPEDLIIAESILKIMTREERDV